MQNRDDTMRASRRHFLQNSALGVAALPAMMLGGHADSPEASGHDWKLPKSILALQPVASKVVPISDDERRARMARAQQLMGKHGIDAIFVDAGTTLDYFTGLRWWNSERTMGMLLPRSGDPVYIVPAFERSRTQAQIRIGSDVRTWQENESPYAVIADVMRERHAGTGVLGIDDRVPFYRATEIGKALPQAKLVEATPVTAGCRAIKSPAELALMQIACDATLSVYRAIWEGLEPGDLRRNV
jgi:Xaa-Pro dipeptidase